MNLLTVEQAGEIVGKTKPEAPYDPIFVMVEPDRAAWRFNAWSDGGIYADELLEQLPKCEPTMAMFRKLLDWLGHVPAYNTVFQYFTESGHQLYTVICVRRTDNDLPSQRPPSHHR